MRTRKAGRLRTLGVFLASITRDADLAVFSAFGRPVEGGLGMRGKEQTLESMLQVLALSIRSA
jgi:hypothetical protein